MYKRDYHPDENIVFDTKNYGFTSPKSTGLEPLSNALVQIDAALKKEETERIKEDVRINGRVDKEIEDRKRDVATTNSRFAGRHTVDVFISGLYGGCYGVFCVAQKIDNVLAVTCSGNMYGVFDLPLSKIIGKYSLSKRYGTNGSVISVIPDPNVTGRYAKIIVIGGTDSISINTGMGNTTDSSKAIPLSFTVLVGLLNSN